MENLGEKQREDTGYVERKEQLEEYVSSEASEGFCPAVAECCDGAIMAGERGNGSSGSADTTRIQSSMQNRLRNLSKGVSQQEDVSGGETGGRSSMGSTLYTLRQAPSAPSAAELNGLRLEMRELEDPAPDKPTILLPSCSRTLELAGRDVVTIDAADDAHESATCSAVRCSRPALSPSQGCDNVFLTAEGQHATLAVA